MNVLFYIPDLSQEWGGVRQYAVGLLKILAKDSSRSFFVYHNAQDPEVVKVLTANKHLLPITDDDVRHKVVREFFLFRFKRLANIVLRVFKRKFRFLPPNVADIICKQYNIDVVHCPYQYVPNVSGVKLVTTLHDVQELHFPEYFSAEERAYRASAYLDFLRRADKVVVSYQHVKMDLITLFNVPESNIHVVLLDMEELWLDNFIGTKPSELDRFNLPDQFLFYPANTWKHKNHVRLLHALAYLRDNHGRVVNVVFTGHKNDHYATIEATIKELRLDEQVRFAGVVSEEVLYALYKRCRGVVVPTTYEAGSFPVIESILLNVPVICSNVTSLPETIQDQKFLFDPFSIKGIAEKIEQLWGDEHFRDQSVENARKVAPDVRYAGAQQKLLNLYNEIQLALS